MAVSVTDVRDALNNISSANLADNTITQKIADGIRIVEDMGIIVEATQDPVVRAYAAWQSFIISKDYYDSLRAVDLSRKKKAEDQADLLELNFNREIGIAAGGGYGEPVIVESTPMFDDRPEEDDDTDGTI